MHEVLHIAVLTSVLLGAGGLVLAVLWPLVADAPLPPKTKGVLAGLIATGVLLLVAEWRLIH